MSKSALALIDSVVDGKPASWLVEVAAHRQRTITPSTIAQWKKDLRRLTKIYKSIDPSPWDYDYTSPGTQEQDKKRELAKFEEARKIYAKFRANFEAWVYIGLLGMPSTSVRGSHEYWSRETNDMEAVRKSAHKAVWSMDTQLFPTGWDHRVGEHLPEPWKLTDREKKKQIGRYQRPFSAAFKDIEHYLKRQKGAVTSMMPKTETMDIAGFHVRIEKGGFTKDPSYLEKDIQSTVETLKRALPMLKSKAKKVYPRLTAFKLPLVYDADVDLDRAATYSRYDNLITLKACGINKFNPAETARVIAHEICHHIWSHVLSDKAKDYWTKAIKADLSRLDVNKIDKLWTDESESLVSFIFRIQNAHPDLHLQLVAYAEGYIGDEGTRLNTREDFFRKVSEDPPTVMKNPITAYAHKNAEEAFCEALSSLVIYGKRTVYPLIRLMLRTVLPEIRTEQVDDAIDRVTMLQESPEEVIDSFIKAN